MKQSLMHFITNFDIISFILVWYVMIFFVYEVYNHNKLVVVKWMQDFYSWERWNLVYKESHVNIVKNRSSISLANRRKATPALEGDVIILRELMQNLALCTYGFFFISPYLLWQWALVLTISSKGPLQLCQMLWKAIARGTNDPS